MSPLLSTLFYFVTFICSKYKIDESHGLSHSMDVLHFANNIFEEEVKINPELQNQERIIYVSSILHDMCDKKYMCEDEGIANIEEFLQDKLEPYEIDITKKIVKTMSYSKVKKNGFPELGKYSHAYHIVREADLLAAYDFDRCMVYNMLKFDGNVFDSFDIANKLFEVRIFQHNNDGLFVTDYSKKLSNELHNSALQRISVWKKIVNKPFCK